MSLTDCPLEILEDIVGYIATDTQSLSVLIRTCRYTRDVLTYQLYQSITCKGDRAGAACCRTLASSPHLCKMLEHFAVLGPATMFRDNAFPTVLLQDFTRDFTKALQQTTGLKYLNCDVPHCSLEVALTLCEGKFSSLRSLALRFDDTSLTAPFRTFQQLEKLGAPLFLNLTRFIVRDNARQFHSSLFVNGVINSRLNDLKVLMLSFRADIRESLRRTVVPPSWSSLETLVISRAIFDQTLLDEMPHLRRLTIVRDTERLPTAIPSTTVPRLEYLGCSPMNIGAFLPPTTPGPPRPIRSIQLNGASLSGAYDGASYFPDTWTLREGLRGLQFSGVTVEHFNFAMHLNSLRHFAESNIPVFMSAVKHLVFVFADSRRASVSLFSLELGIQEKMRSHCIVPATRTVRP